MTKPAILTQTGTSSKINISKLSERPEPPEKKPSIDLAQPKKKAAARELRLKQERKKKELLEAEKARSEAVADDRAPSDTSSTSVR